MTYDVVIVGNGVLGSTTALFLSLADPQLRIGIVGRRARPLAASVAAGAMLNLFSEVEPDTLTNAHHRFKFDLGVQAKNLWPAHVEWLNGLAGADGDLRIQPGTFIINNTRADAFDDRSFDAVVDALTEYRQPFQQVDPTTIDGYAPAPAHRALRAIYLPEEGFVPSKRLFRTIDAALARRPGIESIDAEVTAIATGREHQLALSSGARLTAAKVLVANGAAAQPLIDAIPDLQRRMPRLFYGVGCGLVLRPPVNLGAVVRTNNRGLACGLHTVPDAADGTCYVGASNFICQYAEAHVRAGSVQTLLRAAIDEINVSWYKAPIEEMRVGHRPTSADLFPLIGPTSIDGLYVLNGTKRDGLYMSPVYARAMTDAMLSGGACFGGRFAPERDLIVTMTREEGIRKGIAHMWSSGYQHELRLPHAGWEGHVQRMLEGMVLDAYEKSGNPDYGIPPELLDMYRYGHITPAGARHERAA